VVIEKILAALTATRDGLGNPLATTRGPYEVPTTDAATFAAGISPGG
jgi:hypothetical protein